MPMKPREICSAVLRSIIDPAEPGRAKREARELQAGRRLFGDVADDIQGVGLGLRVVILVEDFEAVIDGTDGIDDVVANLARNQSCKFEIGRMHALVHGIAPIK